MQIYAAECVILLHGLARSHVVMLKLERTLKHHHYWVVNQDYPSTTKTIKKIADEELPRMIKSCLSYKPDHISFVTHSMGGIILQVYLQNHQIPKLKSIVMISPPNHGSPVADLLQNVWAYKFITGPAGQELITAKRSVPNRIHLNHSYQIGIITGTINLFPFSNFLFKGANDGAVSVASAKTKYMKDFLTMPASHAFIMSNYYVHKQILNFLSEGKFSRRWECIYCHKS